MNSFTSADILLPGSASPETWAVIACDQFSSDPAYWDEVRKLTAEVPSTFHLILPEAELGTPQEDEHTLEIFENMKKYRENGIFTCYPDSYIYVERTMENGTIRKGLVGMVDLDAYDFSVGSASAIRATEKTVVERIPPRQKIRRDASIELPHVLMLCDDHERLLIEPIAAKKAQLPKLYDFDLMMGGGHISGWLVNGEAAETFDRVLADYSANVDKKYEGLHGVPMVFAVGDGNHSLATAKTCYEELKAKHPGEDLSRHPARYALVELENIHDEALEFEPIHRFVCKTDPKRLLSALEQDWCADGGYPVQWYIGETHGTVYLDRAKSELAVGVLQSFLNEYTKENEGVVDYIHDDDALIALAAQEDSIGFLLPAMEKSQLFRGVIADGILPRKTFSMGHSREKRYYLEARAISE
ncbi:MAG: DUF1015 domain-containing protein [Ruminococcaceae bacterium]|nr:DUF1015 domain-containing protein [Oscillospiraceae bacterium]